MCGLAHRRMARILAACSRLRTACAPTIPRGVLARRWHSTATTVATALRSRHAHPRCNGAKLRARLRPRVRFTAAVDTNCAKYGQNIGAAEPLEIGHLRNK